MKHVHTNSKLPVKMWLHPEINISEVKNRINRIKEIVSWPKVTKPQKIEPIEFDMLRADSLAMRQIDAMGNHPFLYRYGCVMPDAHGGYGMPIGGVLPTEGVVIPNSVGVDINCGMAFMELNLKATNLDRKTLISIVENIRKRVPVGYNIHPEPQESEFLDEYYDPTLFFNKKDRRPVTKDQASRSIGTLGRGNHFIEIQIERSKDAESNVFIMIHSGSRSPGYQVASYFKNKAEELNRRWNSSVPKGLEFLPLDSIEGSDYWNCMSVMMKFAVTNRAVMMEQCHKAFCEVTKKDIQHEQIHDVPHNYAAIESHYGKNVVVHRKGATRARQGELCIIPGSIGSYSYICSGKGNQESFNSCSHGAGRAMSRTRAIEGLNLDKERKNLDSKGIIHNINNNEALQEATGAYKDINKVMEYQSDLVEIDMIMRPIASIKGDHFERN